MLEQENVQTPTNPPVGKPNWLQGMGSQAELIKVWNDVFESNCSCDICVRLRKALSEIKTPPTGSAMSQP